MRLRLVALAVFLINLPFGYWRAGVPARSRQWFLAIRLPVPAVIALRIFPVFVGAFFLGQFVGGKMRRIKH